MLDYGIVLGKPRGAFGQRKAEAQRTVEGVAGGREEAAVPHELRIERVVDHRRSPALIARTRAAGAHHPVTLDADGHRLRVPHARAGRMTTRARIVFV